MLKQSTVWPTMVILIILTLCTSSCKSTNEPTSLAVGLLNPNKATQAISKGFIDGLREYDQDNRINIIEYPCEGSCVVDPCEGTCDIDSSLQELIGRNVSMLFTVTTPATKKARVLAGEKNIPLVFAMNDPIHSGVINSLANPGGNLTGIQIGGSVPKSLEWLITIAPSVEHIVVPIKFDTKAAKQSLEDLKNAATQLGKKITVVEINSAEELDDFLSTIPENVDALFFLHSIFIASNAEKITAVAHKKKIPTAAAIALSESGVLVSFSPRLYDLGKQASSTIYSWGKQRSLPRRKWQITFWASISMRQPKWGSSLPMTYLCRPTILFMIKLQWMHSK